MPVYECLMETGKGPQIFGPSGSFIAPDMIVFRSDRAIWIEAKHKTAFTMHRVTGRWVTGIDIRHYKDYCRVDDISPWPVWLLFLHRGGQAKDSPPDSPSGLFGNDLSFLRKTENHRHENHGSSGMVYWAISNLKHIASIDEIAP
jgi:hypothetical protein